MPHFHGKLPWHSIHTDHHWDDCFGGSMMVSAEASCYLRPNKAPEIWKEQEYSIFEYSFLERCSLVLLGCERKPQKMKKNLVVNFINTGECGSDCGALKREFFKDALSSANEMLFEGEDNRRIPRKDFSLSCNSKLQGCGLSSEILQLLLWLSA